MAKTAAMAMIFRKGANTTNTSVKMIANSMMYDVVSRRFLSIGRSILGKFVTYAEMRLSFAFMITVYHFFPKNTFAPAAPPAFRHLRM